MRVRAPWLALGCAGLLGCGLSNEGLESRGDLGAEAGSIDATGSSGGMGFGEDATPDGPISTTVLDGSARPTADAGKRAEAGVPDAAPDRGAGGVEDGGGESGSDAGVPPDAGKEAGPDAETGPPPGCDASAGCVVVPSGWTLVAFATEQAAACPPGFGTPSDLIEGVDATSACVCSTCSVTGQPSCASGAVDVYYDLVAGVAGAGTCPTPATYPSLDNSPAGSCGTGKEVYTGDYALLDLKYIPPAPTGGTCTAPGSGTGAVTYAARDRACVPTSSQSAGCVGDVCTPALGGSYSACIMQAGTTSCPQGPLSVLHLAGSGVSFGCTACDCSVSADCTGTITLYTDTECQDPGVQIPADGSCNRVRSLPNSASSYSFNAYTYAGNAPTSVACSASGTSSPENVALAGPVTICCAP